MTATMTIAARRRAGPPLAADIRTLVASLDPRLAIVSSRTLEDSTALGLVPQRAVASLAGGLGTIGLLLAPVGI
jgi:hypothetical protein